MPPNFNSTHRPSPSIAPRLPQDSRAAALVMKVVRNVVNTGRTVISTIHQPSAEVFFLFDELLLLQRGGYQVRAARAGAM